MRLLLAAVTVAVLAGLAQAEQSDRILELSRQATNLDQYRDELEKKLAAEQVKVYRLTQLLKEMEKQLDEAKKAQEKPAEKKAD